MYNDSAYQVYYKYTRKPSCRKENAYYLFGGHFLTAHGQNRYVSNLKSDTIPHGHSRYLERHLRHNGLGIVCLTSGSFKVINLGICINKSNTIMQLHIRHSIITMSLSRSVSEILPIFGMIRLHEHHGHRGTDGWLTIACHNHGIGLGMENSVTCYLIVHIAEIRRECKSWLEQKLMLYGACKGTHHWYNLFQI